MNGDISHPPQTVENGCIPTSPEPPTSGEDLPQLRILMASLNVRDLTEMEIQSARGDTSVRADTPRHGRNDNRSFLPELKRSRNCNFDTFAFGESHQPLHSRHPNRLSEMKNHQEPVSNCRKRYIKNLRVIKRLQKKFFSHESKLKDEVKKTRDEIKMLSTNSFICRGNHCLSLKLNNKLTVASKAFRKKYAFPPGNNCFIPEPLSKMHSHPREISCCKIRYDHIQFLLKELKKKDPLVSAECDCNLDCFPLDESLPREHSHEDRVSNCKMRYNRLLSLIKHLQRARSLSDPTACRKDRTPYWSILPRNYYTVEKPLPTTQEQTCSSNSKTFPEGDHQSSNNQPLHSNPFDCLPEGQSRKSRRSGRKRRHDKMSRMIKNLSKMSL